MDLILETGRLLLRPLELTDVDDFFLMNNNPNVARFLRNPLYTRLEAEKYVQKIIDEYKNNGIGRYAVVLKETNKLIGFCGLKFRNTLENNHVNFYDLGYRFSEEHWYNGFATESSLAWLDYGFNSMKLSTIHACVVSENIGSNNVLKKIGFKMTNQYDVNGILHNWYEIEK